MSNIQVTFDSSLNNARSESALVINPINPLQIVAASKKFNNIHTYDFTLATAYSIDGGRSWQDSAPFTLPPGATVMTDPTLAWDDAGNVFSVGLVGNNPPEWDTIGIAIYKSTDGGQTWGSPNVIHTSTGDDKQWMAGDGNQASPYHGRVYAVWDDGSVMRFARTLDHGGSWIGTGTNSVASTSLANDSFAPEINVSANGDVYIVWIAGSTIKMLVSTDGGDSFHGTTPPATGVTTLSSSLPNVGGFPVLPGGNFRVLTLPTACVYGKTVAVAWDDFREGSSRIYRALSTDGGTTWSTGPSGQPLLTSAIDPALHHILPQIVADPAGVFGCAFYEFGPKPTTPKIDVIMAQSFDGGATFDHFTVTDQPWDPVVDAPWSHGDSSVTFIGDYFGLDASALGFYPLWTDTRTGIQELFTAIVPEKKCVFVVNRSTLGQDEVDARRALPGGAVIPDAFRVVVDGFAATELGITGTGSTLPVASPAAGMTIVPRGNVSATLGYGPAVQRFTFFYDIDFGATDLAFGFPGATRLVTLHVDAGPTSAEAQLELIKQPDPFLLHGDTFWLSIDLRVFVVRAGESKFGVPGVADAGDAPRFIQQLISTVTPAQFDSLSAAEGASKLYLQPRDENGQLVFNFALAKVHYIGLIGATNVRVFFRLFQAQTTTGVFDYPPGAQYRRATGNPHGQPIALPGIIGNEYVTIPCFAQPRVDSTVVSLNRQTDDHNVRPITAHGDGSEVDTFFGCWLDINQPFAPDGVTPNNRLPVVVPGTHVDGPFTDPSNPPLPIQQAILRSLHQCLIAEIAFDPVPIPVGKDPSNWDKLAQRNLAWSDVGSSEAVSTFEIRPTPLGQPASFLPDELMIDWGDLPRGGIASIHVPAVSADEILAMAGRMYTLHGLVRADDHTLQCKTAGVTYLPIPPGSGSAHAGVLSVELPDVLRREHVYKFVVRQVTNAYSRGVPPRQIESGRPEKEGVGSSATRNFKLWRRVLGAFQLSIPVRSKQVLRVVEERDFAVLRWINQAIPSANRWHPVFRRYLEIVSHRVRDFGGNPLQIPPSPTGDGAPRPPHPGGHGGITGMVEGLIFDHHGEFEGFILGDPPHARRFYSREQKIEFIAERAWRERLRITVWAEHHEPHRPGTIVVHPPGHPLHR
ncbi:MAG TPA: sialidase family protein [Kofleriaceae bacterium]